MPPHQNVRGCEQHTFDETWVSKERLARPRDYTEHVTRYRWNGITEKFTGRNLGLAAGRVQSPRIQPGFRDCCCLEREITGN